MQVAGHHAKPISVSYALRTHLCLPFSFSISPHTSHLSQTLLPAHSISPLSLHPTSHLYLPHAARPIPISLSLDFFHTFPPPSTFSTRSSMFACTHLVAATAPRIAGRRLRHTSTHLRLPQRRPCTQRRPDLLPHRQGYSQFSSTLRLCLEEFLCPDHKCAKNSQTHFQAISILGVEIRMHLFLFWINPNEQGE
ncbi:hypothetical protein MRB53_024357 [Persea americana]|uniref:Uncharacterized protein n=1 Tax=Persea americana TaxID=3435 RepID=A0ACC2LDC7_PERAE|nr:hypothetical protein MRB53_024357 [Persea americana]